MDNHPTAAAGPDVYPYLQKLYSLGGSDMFFSVGTQPQLKVEGLTHPVGSEVMKPGAVQHMAYQLMTQKQVAEFERDLIRLRTREGMKIARDKGKLRGKPPKLSDLQQRELLKMHATGEYSISDLGKLFKVSRPTVYRTIQRNSTD